MPDACDFIVDLQLAQAEVFAAKRLMLLTRRVIHGGTADCVRCGEPIAADRLEAEPSACRCVPCQNHFEIHGSRPTWKPVTY